MPDKNKFDPEKIALIDFKMIKGQVETPENFDNSKIVGHQLDNTLQLGFSIEDKLAKADFTINITTDSKSRNADEATGKFHLLFIYRIENLDELAFPGKNNNIDLDPALANAISSITYSTSRGILLIRLQGTELQNFILPIINPGKLLHKKE